MRYARNEWSSEGMKGETKIKMMEKQSNVKQIAKAKRKQWPCEICYRASILGQLLQQKTLKIKKVKIEFFLQM